MAEKQPMEAAPQIGKPGIAVRGFPPNTDDEFLGLYFSRFGSDIKHIEIFEDNKVAYIEFSDPAVISQVVSKSHSLRKTLVTVEEVDLLLVWQPYLIVRGFPPFVKEQMLKHHFKGAANGAEVESVELKGSEAHIVYEDPKVTLEVASKRQKIVGAQLTVEVGYSSPKPPEECVLVIKGLPDYMDDATNKEALKWYFKQEAVGEYEVTYCELVEGVAYVGFTDPSVVHRIVSQPPKEEFMAGVCFQMSAIPITEVPTSMREKTPPVDIPTQQQQQHQEGGSSTSPPQFLLSPPGSQYGTSPDRSLQEGTWATHVARSSFPTPHQEPQASSPFMQRSVIQSGIHPSFNIPPKGFQQPLIVEDLDSPFTQQPVAQPAESFMQNKVLVEGFPPETQEFVLKLFLESLLPTVQCTEVKLRGNMAIATFTGVIDLNYLLQQSSVRPFPQNNQVLTFRPLKPTDTILVSGMPSGTPGFAVSMYFEHMGGAVKAVNLIPPNQALVTFNSHQCVQKVLSYPQHILGETPLTIKEYQPFIDPLPTFQAEQLPEESIVQQPKVTSSHAVKHIWSVQMHKISTNRQHFLQNTMSELNEELEPLKASASIKTEASVPHLLVTPLSDAGSIPDWEERVADILHKHFKDFKEAEYSFLSQAKGDVLEYITNIRNDHPKLYVRPSGNVLTVAGKSDLVDEILEKVADICQSFQVVVTDLEFPRKHILFLTKFCTREMENVTPPVEYYKPDPDSSTITVRANPMALQAFQDLLDAKMQTIHEKTIQLSPEAYKLLFSQKGFEMIETTTTMSRLVYDFEDITTKDGTPTHQLCLLSPEKETAKTAATRLKSCTSEKTIHLTQTKLSVCSSANPGWRQFEQKLTKEFLVLITVKDDMVIVTGESIALEGPGGIPAKIEQFLDEQVSTEDRLQYEVSEWKVIRESLKNELDGVKHQSKLKKVALVPPKDSAASKATFIIKGEPAAVLDIKTQLEMLRKNVHKKETKIRDVAGLVRVLQSMEDRLHILEQKHKAAIEVDVERGDTGNFQQTGAFPQRVCVSISPDATRVTVFMGDFTQYPQMGTLINFLTRDPNYKQGKLKSIIEAGGSEVQDDIQSKISQFMILNYSQVFKSKHGHLGCMQLLHCVVPQWNGGSQNEAFCLEEALQQAFQTSTQFGSVVVTPATSPPFKYPVKVFAEKVIDTLGTSAATGHSSDVHVFVDDLSQAREFEECLSAKNYQIVNKAPATTTAGATATSPTPTSPMKKVRTSTMRAVSSQIDSFITLTRGSMLEHQADVYINSTNPDMELSQGQLSNTLLKACGKELQDECKQYAPLGPGKVAVTDAKNLKCKYIFHVALPDYKTAGSERVFRETVQTLLRSAEAKQVSSMIIPSLGVANLHYPAPIAATILFDEVIAFHARKPSAIQRFHFVIYDKDVYQVFNKVYVQHMTSTTQQASSSSDRPSVSVRRGSQRGQQGPQGTRLYVTQGDIAEEKSDVIVNTTAEDMNLMNNAVSRAIARKAGPNLQSVCRQLVDSGLKLEHGNVAVTNACGQLRCKKVIHAHVPLRQDAAKMSVNLKPLIENIVTECLQKAENDGQHSISFPAFGMGAAGYSAQETAEPMLQALQKFGKTNPKSVNMVRIMILDQDRYDEFYTYFCTFFNKAPAAATPGYGLLHSLGSSIKATLGMGSHADDGDYVELQPLPAGVVSYRSPADRAALSIPTSALANPVAVFRIFAASAQIADRIADEIREDIKSRVAKEEVKEDGIAFLLEDDVQEISDIGDQFGVVIKILSQIKQIAISGERTRVNEAKMKIVNMMREIEKAKSEVQMFDWQSHDGDTFEPYPEEAAVRLERASQKGIKAVEMTIDDIEVMVDLKAMRETCKGSGNVRSVRRVRKTHVGPLDQEPEESLAENDRNTDLPPTWEEQPKDNGKPKACHMFDVPAGTQEYLDAVREFEATMDQKHAIIRVRRIQNPSEYSKHCAFRETLKHKHGKANVLEKRLFHGTKSDSIVAIAHQGFNRIFAADANAAVFGKGVYFAVNASYSAQEQYAVPDKDGNQDMFVCNLIVGEFVRGSRTMKVAPNLPNNPNLLYDTLVNNERDPAIFVAMTDSQAYPEYLITFKVEKPAKK